LRSLITYEILIKSDHIIYRKKILSLLPYFIILCVSSLKLSAQQCVDFPGGNDSALYSIDSSSKLRIAEIDVEGNNKTKSYIILREMLIREGDSVIAGTIYEKLENSKKLIYNTQLFVTVDIKPYFEDPQHVRLKIIVKERWYVFPVPQFQFVDRNLNEWLNEYGGDLERVIYGMKFVHYNLSGRKDQLRLFLLNGYSRNFSASYNAPYSNPSLTEGFSVAASFTQNREISYGVSKENKLKQFSNGTFVRDVFSVEGNYQIRRGFYNRTVIMLRYVYQHVTDSVILKYNPNYFGTDNSSTSDFPEIAYSFSHIDVDNVAYPLNGRIKSINLLKRGLELSGGNNMLQLEGSYAGFAEPFQNWYFSGMVNGMIKLPLRQSYLNQRALGYGNYTMRGLEYYVVDGVMASLAKGTIRRKLLSFSIPFPFKIKSIPNLPFTFFGKTYADLGYCFNKQEFATNLNNRLLYSGGIGMDVLMLYDINARLEFSFNQLGEKGLFLHVRSGF